MNTDTMSLLSVCLMPLLIGAVLFSGGCNKPPTPAADATAPVADAAAVPTPAVDPDAMVADVNGHKVTRAQVDKALEQMMAAQSQGGMPPEMMGQMRPQMEKQAVDRLVVQALLEQEADRQKVTADTKEVDVAVSNLLARLPPGVTLETALTRFNITEQQFRTDIGNDLRIRKVVDVVLTNVTVVTDADIEAFYTTEKARFEVPEGVHARHVLIACDASADEAARTAKKTLADTLREQLAKGSNFADVARMNSDCPSKEQGGDLGTLSRGDTVKPFEDAAFAQAVNDIGPVVETQFGYHIIQVLEHKTATNQPLSAVKGDITSFLERQHKQEALGKYIDTLKAAAKISYAN